MIGTVADWITYAEARGDTVANEPASAQALQRASDYITYYYVSRFVSPYDATSPYVEDAAYEAAKLELATPGFFAKTFTPSQQKVLTEVKGIKWTVVTPNSHESVGALAAPRSTIIDAMLAPYMPFGKTLGGYVV